VYRCDVSDSASVARFAEALAGRHINTLVNNAGIFDHFAAFETMPESTWNSLVAVNLTGPFLVTQALLPGLKAAGGACVINIASVAGLKAGTGGVAYIATKHGVIGLTRQMAVELGSAQIRVNAVCPGVIEAGMSMPLLNDPARSVETMNNLERLPSGRTGRPEEIGALAAFLAGDSATYINGAALPIDGGWTA
jgi:NAD(P)-dependent dehydrogenase (short-subunit alcohol dehydrogenase family)